MVVKGALGLMTAKCKETVTKLEDLDGCVIRDELPSRRRAESFVKSASKAWNLVRLTSISPSVREADYHG